MKSQFYRMIHTKKSVVLFCFILFIPFIEVIQLFILNNMHDVMFHPAFASFLSGMSQGHVAQILLLWFLPIYLLILCADDSIQDAETGYKKILLIKISKKKYYNEKLLFSFIVSSGSMFLTLLFNFILVTLFFHGGTYKNGLDGIELSENWLFTFSLNHPYYALLLFSLMAIILAGFAGVLGASMSLLFSDRKFSYTATFFIWFVLILRKNSLMFVFQPFAEYGLEVILPIFFTAIGLISMIAILVLYYEVKRDEL